MSDNTQKGHLQKYASPAHEIVYNHSLDPIHGFRTWNQVLFRYINGEGLNINCLYERAVDNGTCVSDGFFVAKTPEQLQHV